MNLATTLNVFLLALFPTLASAQSACPIPEGLKASVEMTKEAIAGRKAGQTKQQMDAFVGPLMARLPWAGTLMQTVIDEVYFGSEPLEPEVHAAYRMEACFLLNQHPDAASKLNFKDAYPLLKTCVSADKGVQTKCSMRVAHQISGIPE